MDSTERKYTVYMHTAPNGKKYIGITCQKIAQRWRGCGKGYKTSTLFWNAIMKYGWDNIIHQVIATGLTEEEAKKTERDLISIHQTRDSLYGYNLTDGGDGMCGFHHSEVTKKKLSAANEGKTIPAEMHAKARAANMGNQHTLGYKHTAETRAKMSAAHTGKPRTAEAKMKMRAAQIRLANNVERLTADGESIGHYVSLVDASEKTGINKGHIWEVCSGRRKTAGGYKWRYV